MRWNKLSTVFLLVIFLASPVLAVRVVQEGWHEYRDTFTLESVVYDISINENNYDVIRFKADNFATLIQLTDCKSNGDFRYCFTNSSFEPEFKATISSATGNLVPGLYLIITKDELPTADITLTTSSKNPIRYAETDTFTYLIKNAGTGWLSGADFKVVVPKGIEVTNVKEFQKIGNTLNMLLNIAPGETREVSFGYKSVLLGTHILNYTLIFPGISSRNVTGASVVTVSSPYNFSVSLSPTSLNIMDAATLLIKFNNNEENDVLTVNRLEVKFPPTVSYASVKNLQQVRPGVFSSTIPKLSPGDAAELSMRLYSGYEGSFNVSVNGDFFIFGQTLFENITKLVTVNANGPSANFYLTKSELKSGSTLDVYYVLKNSNELLAFYDFNVSVQGGFFEDRVFHAEIKPSVSDVRLITKTIKVPTVENDTSYRVVAFTEYRTATGEKKSFNNTFDLKVIGSGPIASLRQSVSPTLVYPGSEIIVEVYAKNLIDDLLSGVKVTDYFNKNLKLIVGNPSETVDLTSKAEKRMYLYKVQVPENFVGDSFNITSKLSIDSLNYKLETSTIVNVLKNESQVGSGVVTNDTVSNNDSVNPNPDIAPKKDGFFRKLFRDIENFFSKLFAKK